ncbi:FitA-like ribbon-helix-helix domain-containing protein [Actinophytocola sediminis]
MATIQIRDVPDEDAEVLRSRAAAAGMSLQEYMRQQLIMLARRHPKAATMATVRETLARDPEPGADEDTIAGALRELRGE